MIDEDGSLTLTLSASDVDGDELTFTASNGNADISIDGDVLTITPEANYNGEAEVTVQADDGEYTSTTTFILTVNPVNDTPVLSDLADGTVAEDTDFVITLSADDIDGDDLTYFAQVGGNGSVAVNGSTLTVTPATDYNGDIEVTVTVTDDQASDSGSFTLAVTSVNDAPVVDSITDQTVAEDTSLTLTLTASDVDGDALRYRADVDGNGSCRLKATADADDLQ